MPTTNPSALHPNPSASAWLHNPALSLWLSVDPLSDKYPNLSPYVYCANNPVRLVDKDGREIGHIDEGVQKKIDALTNKNSADYSRAFTRQYKRLERSSQVYNFYEATDEQVTTKVTGKVMRENNGDIAVITSSVATARTSQPGGFSQEYSTLFEETYHAADYDRGRLDLDNPTCMDEARAWKFAAKAPGTNLRCGLNNRDLSLTNCFRTKTVTRLAQILHNGYSGTTIDIFGRAHEYLISDKNDETKGLYYNIPIK